MSSIQLWHHFLKQLTMKERYAREFYPTWLLLVTGFSFLLFTLLLSIVDGVNIQLFLWIGGIAFVLGLLTGAVKLATRAKRSNKSSLVP